LISYLQEFIFFKVFGIFIENSLCLKMRK